jgi:hypothetical protein
MTAALILACIACETRNKIYPVSGTVTYQGAPAAGATVFFQRQGGDPMNEHLIMGIVQQDGSFELVCGSLGKGAPPGTYDVLIEWKQASSQGKGRPQHRRDRLKGRYADPKRPLLQARVQAKANTLPPFALTDAETPQKK